MSLPAEVRAVVSSYLELAPGLPATERNLAAMLKRIEEFGNYRILHATATVAASTVIINIGGTKKRPVLVLDVFEARVRGDLGPSPVTVFRSAQPVTTQGLLTGMVEVKDALARLSRGLCERCALEQPPLKRLKATGMPSCIDCAISSAFGL